MATGPGLPEAAAYPHIVVMTRDGAWTGELIDPIRDQGFRVHVADSAERATTLCHELRPAVAVLDPRVDDGLAARLRRDPDLFMTSVLLAGPEPLRAEHLASGVQDHVGFPLDAVQLLARVRSAAHIAALRGELARQADQLEELAYTDELTQLHNRRFLSGQLNALVAGSRRHQRALGVVLVDVDRFKTLNDEHGHEVGDLVLQDVARRMAARLREEDLLGRWGGEEFLVLLPDTEVEGARLAAEGLREAVAETPVGARGATIAVTVSAGVAGWTTDETPRQVLRRADAALYAAKADGRDRVVGR